MSIIVVDTIEKNWLTPKLKLQKAQSNILAKNLKYESKKFGEIKFH